MSKVKNILKYILLILITLVFLFPVVYMLCMSVMSTGEIENILDFSGESYKGIHLIPESFSLDQFYQVFFRRVEYLHKFWNSIIITVPTVIGQVVVCSLAAFAFGKLEFKGRDKLFFLYIALLMLPTQVTLVPNYIVLDKLSLLNSFLAVIFPGMFSAFGVCLLRQSIRYIPNSSIEAARIDGASYFRIFFSVILPQIKGGLVTLTLLCFIDSYNLVEQPLAYFSNENMYPLSVGLSQIGSYDTEIVFACGVMFMIPPLLIYFIGEKDVSSPFASVDKG